MRVLVADDGQSLRTLLQTTIEPTLIGQGHELLVVSDAAAARRAFEDANPPLVALLDWNLTGTTGPEFCRQIRAANLPRRPHLLLVADSENPRNLVQGLDGGADDCLPNAFHPAELLARLNAGLRSAQYQAELHQLLAQRDALLKDHGAARVANLPAGTDVALGTPSLQHILETLCPLAELDDMITRTLSEMGLGDVTPTTDPAAIESFDPEIGIVHFMILPEKSTWLDLLLETDRKSALALYQLFAGGGDNVPDSDLTDVMNETLNMIQGSVKAAFKTKNVELIVPLVPQNLPPEKMPVRAPANAVHSRHLYRLDGIDLRFTLLTYLSPIQQKPLRELGLANVLAEPLRPIGNADLVLINRGTLLNQRALKKVSSVAEFAPAKLTHPVFEPSPLTELIANE